MVKLNGPSAAQGGALVRAIPQNLKIDVRECYLHAEECRRWAKIAPTPSSKADFLDMERRWLSLAHGYELQNGHRAHLESASGIENPTRR
jgi:hypothetical protein